jgi:hypothetical protein
VLLPLAPPLAAETLPASALPLAPAAVTDPITVPVPLPAAALRPALLDELLAPPPLATAPVPAGLGVSTHNRQAEKLPLVGEASSGEHTLVP